MDTTDLSVVEGNRVSSSTDKLRIRKISKQEKYKIYNISTGEILELYDSRKLAHNALKEHQQEEKKKQVRFDDSVVVVRIKNGDNLKHRIKEEIKK
jgi:hypothetical protein